MHFIYTESMNASNGGAKGGARAPVILANKNKNKIIKKCRRKKSRQGKQYSQINLVSTSQKNRASPLAQGLDPPLLAAMNLFPNSCHHTSTYGLALSFHTLVKTNKTHNPLFHSDEGLMIEKSSFLIFHGGNSTEIFILS